MTTTFTNTAAARLAAGLCLAAIAAGAQAQGGYKAVHTGHGTFYDYSGGGNCSFPYTPGLLTAAMNTGDYDTARACGAYIAVTNIENGKTVVVRIDDRCPGCSVGDIDLTRESFARIARTDEGVIPIRWRYVSGPSTPVEVVFEDGSSQWWTSIQVRNHRNPVAKLAWRASGTLDAFAPIERQMWNYFIDANGMGPGPYDLRVTDVFGNNIKTKNVPLTPGGEVSLRKQFPVELPMPGLLPAW